MLYIFKTLDRSRKRKTLMQTLKKVSQAFLMATPVLVLLGHLYSIVGFAPVNVWWDPQVLICKSHEAVQLLELCYISLAVSVHYCILVDCGTFTVLWCCSKEKVNSHWNAAEATWPACLVVTIERPKTQQRSICTSNNRKSVSSTWSWCTKP